MEKIRKAVESIDSLSAEELASLKNDIVSEAETLKSQTPSREVVENLTALADAVDAIKAETARREQEASELAAQSEEALARVFSDDSAEEETANEEDAEVAEEVSDADAETELAVSETEEEEVATEEEAPEASLSVAEPEQAELSTSEEPSEEPAELAVGEATEEVTEEVAEAAVEEPVEAEEEPAAELATEEVAEEATEEAAEASVEEAEEIETPAEAEELSVEAPEISEETVNASANQELSNADVPEDRRPQANTQTAPVVITAGADIPGYAAGAVLPNLKAVAQAMLDRRKGMGRTSGGDGEQMTVATFSTTFPEDRTLVSNDTEGNASKLEAVTSPEALVAAGGLCAPVETSYDIFGFGELGRPVRDSLAVFGADRGGIRFVTSPVLEDLNGAVSVWTLQDDIDAATPGAPDPVKPCLRVACGEEVTVYTDAIPLCLTFGNLGARAWPELVERHTELGMIAHARFAETRLLTRIGSLSTAVTTEAELGAARDVFVAIEKAAAGYRSRYRLAEDHALRVIFPQWFKNALRADVTKQLPGDGQDVTFNLAEATINRWFDARNINVTWHMDGEAGQIFGEQEAGELLEFPENVVWYLFAEGTFVFLDGGTLDLGLVRDSTLNGTNDYKIFLETFEGVAKVGIESLRVTTPVRLYGATAATVDTTVGADGGASA